MLTPEQKAKRLAPLKDLQVYMYATKNENGNTVSKLLLPSIMNLIGHYMLILMPTKLECLSALVTFMQQQESIQFDTTALDDIAETLKNASGMKDSEWEVIDKIYNSALAKVTKLIGNNKEELLRKAAKTGNQLAVIQLLKMDGIDVNAKDNNGRTALMRAARHGHETVVAQLLKVIGIDVNAKNKNGYTALILAAREGYKNIVAQLLKVDGININARNKNGITALMWAAGRDHKTVVHQLCLHQLFVAPFEQNQALFQQLQNEIQSVVTIITITPASLCEYFLKSSETLPTPAEQIALLEKALSKDNAFSALMTEKLFSQIQDALNDLRTLETKPVIFSSSSAEASSSSSTNKASCNFM